MGKTTATLEKMVMTKVEEVLARTVYNFEHAGAITAQELRALHPSKVGSIIGKAFTPGKFTCMLLFPNTYTYKVLTNTRGYPLEFRSAEAARNYFVKNGNHTNISFEGYTRK